MTDPFSARADGTADSAEVDDYLSGQHPLDADAALWAARGQDGLSADEAAELQAWLAGDPARGERLRQLEELWGRLDDLPSDDVAALKAAVAPPHAAPSAHEHTAAVAAPRPSQPTRPGRRAWLLGWGRFVPQMAAAGLATVVLTGGWLGWNHWQQQPTFTQSFATARGQQLTARLPDGSTLRLDTATRLNVTLYRQRREVVLPHGQAMFEVQADGARPFHVLAGPMRITVLGTRFSVRHLQHGADAGRIKVVVEEGRVRVARAAVGSHGLAEEIGAGSDGVLLTAGQAAVADAEGRIATITATELSAALAWRDGRVVLNDTPLADAVAEFERYVDTGLVITDPAVAALRLNGSFDLRQASVFKRALPQALPVRLQARPDGKTEVVGGG